MNEHDRAATLRIMEQLLSVPIGTRIKIVSVVGIEYDGVLGHRQNPYHDVAGEAVVGTIRARGRDIAIHGTDVLTIYPTEVHDTHAITD